MGNSQDSNEPVARVRVNSNVPGRINELDLLRPLPRGEHFLYTAPPQRPAEPVTDKCICNHSPLTDDQLDDIAVAARRGNLYDLRIAIERALKIGGKE